MSGTSDSYPVRSIRSGSRIALAENRLGRIAPKRARGAIDRRVPQRFEPTPVARRVPFASEFADAS